MDKKETSYKLFWTYLKRYSLHYTFLFFSMFIFLIIATLLQIPVPLLFKKIVDDVLPQKNLHLLTTYGVLVILIVILREFFNYTSRVAGEKLKNRMYAKLVSELLSDFFMVPYTLFKRYGAGYFQSRIFEEPKNLEDTLTESIVFTIKLLFIFIFGLVACIHISWRLTILVFAFVPLYYLLNGLVGEKVRKMAIKLEEIKARVREYANDVIQSFKFIVTFQKVLSYIENSSMKKEVQKLLDERLKYRKLSFAFSGLYSVISDSMPVFVFFLGIYEIMHGRLTIGGLIAFMELMGYISAPLQHFSDVMVEVQAAIGHITRIEEFKSLKSPDRPRAVKIDEVKEIKLESVDVTIEDKTILRDFSFVFRKGKGYIIRGDNGTGKTTLLDTISGLILPSRGDVIINDRFPIFSVDKKSYRDRLSVAFFPPLLLPFVDENLNMLRDEKYKKLADEHVVHGRKNLRFSELSAGEKQKLNIILTLSKEADFYMFDEPFSNLDINSIEFFKNLIIEETIKKGKGLVVVLHGKDRLYKEYNFETIKLGRIEV